MQRFFRFLAGFLLLIISLAALVLVVDWNLPLSFVSALLAGLGGMSQIAAIVASAAFVLLSLFMMFAGGGKSFAERESNQREIVENESGKVNISMPVLENIALRLASEVEDVREAKVLLKSLPEGVAVLLKIGIASNADILATTTALQDSIKDYFENNIKLNVPEIKVVIVKEIGESKSRVE